MNPYREVVDSIPEIVAKTEVMHPNVGPYDHISLLIVAWNEERRIGGLIEHLKPWFTNFVVCVQDSDDRTLEIAKGLLPGGQVIQDRHWGHGDRSFPMMVETTKTPWCFVVSCDEWPDLELLQSLNSATAYAELSRDTNEAVWVRFAHLIEDIEVPEQNVHLRLFKQYVGWPGTLHSRPNTDKGISWPIGYIAHHRSLDEMIRDYLRYYAVGKGNREWDYHNLRMMHDACVFVAKRNGWAYVKQYEWWPVVADLAFQKEELDGDNGPASVESSGTR